MERDSKGRFVKGNKEGRKFPTGGAQTETARQGGIASHKAAQERKTLKTALEDLLTRNYTNKKGESASGYDIIMIGLFNRARDGDPKAVKLVAELMGEYKQEMDVHADMKGINVQVNNQDTADKLNQILKEAEERQ